MIWYEQIPFLRDQDLVLTDLVSKIFNYQVCNLYYYYYYFIIRDEFEFDDLKYYVLISVFRLTIGIRARLNLNIQNHCFITIKF